VLEWYENPDDFKKTPWKRHVIDSLRCVHSLDVADVDMCGEPEIVCAEHDPFWPYRSRCRTLIYKKAAAGWIKFDLDRRFEHHDGVKVLPVFPGKQTIVSHGWADRIYLHMWEL